MYNNKIHLFITVTQRSIKMGKIYVYKNDFKNLIKSTPYNKNKVIRILYNSFTNNVLNKI